MDVVGQRANLLGQFQQRTANRLTGVQRGLGEARELHPNRGESLAEYVVQLTRQVLALDFLDLDQPRRQLLQLLSVFRTAASLCFDSIIPAACLAYRSVIRRTSSGGRWGSRKWVEITPSGCRARLNIGVD